MRPSLLQRAPEELEKVRLAQRKKAAQEPLTFERGVDEIWGIFEGSLYRVQQWFCGHNTVGPLRG